MQTYVFFNDGTDEYMATCGFLDEEAAEEHARYLARIFGHSVNCYKLVAVVHPDPKGGE
jgi:hypothetical protein